MATIERFEDIEAWKAGRALRKEVYALTKTKPFSSDFALVTQIRRAALSVTANIAEGFEREGNKEFIQFLSQAKGSVGEVRDQLYAALDEGYVAQPAFDRLNKLSQDTTNLIGGFMAYLRRAESSGSKFKRSMPKLQTPNTKLQTPRGASVC